MLFFGALLFQTGNVHNFHHNQQNVTIYELFIPSADGIVIDGWMYNRN